MVGFAQLHVLVPGVKYIKPGLLSFLGIFIFLLPRLRTAEWLKPLGKLMLLFLVSIVPGLFIGYATGKTRSVLITLLQDYTCIFIGASVFIDSVNKIKVLNTVIIFGAILTAQFVITHGGIGPGILYDENDVGLVLTMLFPFTYFSISLYKGKIMKIITIIALLLVLFAIARTLSRGAMVGILPTLFIIWMKSKHKIAVLIIMVVLVILTINFGPKVLTSEFKSIQNTNEGTAGERRYFWELSIEMFKKRPIFGVGAKGWGNAVWSGMIKLKRTVSNLTPHSIYFQLISELGLFGIIAWVNLIFSSFKITGFIRKKLKTLQMGSEEASYSHEDIKICDSFNNSLTVGMVGGLICGLFLSYLYYSHLYFYVAFIQVLYLNLHKISIAADTAEEEGDVAISAG
jgi:O-antigen ligase